MSTYTAHVTYYDIVIEHDGEDRDLAWVDGKMLSTVLEIPDSEEWQPAVYDQALAAAGWRRTGEWDDIGAGSRAPVQPASR